MNCRRLIVCVSLMVCLAAADDTTSSIENGVIGEPEVECASDHILVHFNTDQAFEGNVFVKGHFDTEDCRTNATLDNSVSIRVPFDTDCDVRRQRSVRPKGLSISTTVVISFHPMFITAIDRSYNIKCFYVEVDKEVEAGLNVSMNAEQKKKIVISMGGKPDMTGELRDVAVGDLTTAVITKEVPMPTCTYQVLQGGPDGEPVRYAVVGEQVYHQWQCETEEEAQEDLFCMTVHSCTVDNGHGKQAQLLDENGCAIDKYLLKNLEYNGTMIGGQQSQVFKFADNPTLFFKCQIRLSVKEEEECERPSDDCASSSRGKRSADQPQWLLVPDENELDVFSETITVFEIDNPISRQYAGRQSSDDTNGGNDYDTESLINLLERGDKHFSNGESQQRTGKDRTLCLSAGSLSALFGVVGVVMVVCILTICLFCSKYNNKVDKETSA